MQMNDLISRNAAISLIEGFQRELCPVGMYGRHAVYGAARDRFDDWQFIIDELEKIQPVDAAPVVHARWTTHRTLEHDGEWYCTNCDYEPTVFENTNYCPHCGAKMDGGDCSETD